MNYAKLKIDTYNLIKKSGGACEIHHNIVKAYNSTTHKQDETYDTIFGYATVSNFSDTAVDNKLILAIDIIITFVQSGNIELSVSDIVILGGKSYTVIKPNPIMPDGSTILCHKIQGRK
jgi:hypothetical protein